MQNEKCRKKGRFEEDPPSLRLLRIRNIDPPSLKLWRTRIAEKGKILCLLCSLMFKQRGLLICNGLQQLAGARFVRPARRPVLRSLSEGGRPCEGEGTGGFKAIES
jgi:hypothetical protein